MTDTTPATDWWDDLYDEPETGRDPVDLGKPAHQPDGDEPSDEVDTELDDEDLEDDAEQARRWVSFADLRELLAQHRDYGHRWRVLAYNGTAAGLGWLFGLEPMMRGWMTACGHDEGDPVAGLMLGLGVIVATVLLIDRRSRNWWAPLAWVCRVPLASAVVALALVGNPIHP